MAAESSAAPLTVKVCEEAASASSPLAYQKYFSTERPLEIHAEFGIDPPWEE